MFAYSRSQQCLVGEEGLEESDDNLLINKEIKDYFDGLPDDEDMNRRLLQIASRMSV